MKYQCNVCGAQKDLPEHASDFFVNGQPVCLSPSLTRWLQIDEILSK
jgi:hypothetical protein